MSFIVRWREEEGEARAQNLRFITPYSRLADRPQIDSSTVNRPSHDRSAKRGDGEEGESGAKIIKAKRHSAEEEGVNDTWPSLQGPSPLPMQGHERGYYFPFKNVQRGNLH